MFACLKNRHLTDQRNADGVTGDSITTSEYRVRNIDVSLETDSQLHWTSL